MREDYNRVREINYLLTKRNEYLQDLLWNIREYLEKCKKGFETLDIEYLIKILD